MSRETDMAWVEFCARQHEAFLLDAWDDTGVVSREVAAASALFLASAGEQWFGHRDSLERIAQKLAPGQDFIALVKVARFDYPRFSSMLRARLHHARPLS